jgi:type II restriction/modification system DNA methylase subunit YeeA
LENELRKLLTGFAAEIASVRILDPACGSGNFLYVALKQLLDLEKEVVTLAGDLGVGRFFPSVSPAQLYGIELNPYAHELAQATVWIGYIQWLRDNGFGDPGEPILKPLKNIVQMDAILAYDEQGRPIEPAWPEADVIIGNPPFLGGSKARRELGDKYIEDLRKLYKNRVPGGADFVTYWFERARNLIESKKAKRGGLIATQGIRGGSNRKVLERVKETGNIFWAESDRDWILDGATVHVSMIGFDNGSEINYVLDSRNVKAINSDLTSKIDLADAKRLPANFGIAFRGTTKTGDFDIEPSIAIEMLKTSGNPNGRPNSDVLKPWVNGGDIAGHRRGMWIIDYGIDMPIEEAALYERPFEYALKFIKPVREKSREKALRENWWLFERPRPEMRQALQRFQRYIVTPAVSKHRLFDWLQHPTLPDQQLIVFARDDDYFFGVLHSKPHELWTRAQGTQLREAESGQRYTPTTTFETFPFPWPPGQEPQDDPRVEAVAQAARELVEKRDNWLNPPDTPEEVLKKRTLTNLYNERPTWLKNAHQKLDKAVFEAYGWPEDLTDEEILARLLALNLARAGGT